MLLCISRSVVRVRRRNALSSPAELYPRWIPVRTRAMTSTATLVAGSPKNSSSVRHRNKWTTSIYYLRKTQRSSMVYVHSPYLLIVSYDVRTLVCTYTRLYVHSSVRTLVCMYTPCTILLYQENFHGWFPTFSPFFIFSNPLLSHFLSPIPLYLSPHSPHHYDNDCFSPGASY